MYDRPKTSYVAKFVGEANVLDAVVAGLDGDVLTLDCAGGCARAAARGLRLAQGTPVTLAVRSEQVEFARQADCGIPATVKEKRFAGGMLRIEMALPGGASLVASRHGIDLDVQPGDAVRVWGAPEHAVLVDLPEEAPV